MPESSLERFLAHSLELERQAYEKFHALSESLRHHRNETAAVFFESMARDAEHHIAEVKELADALALPKLAPGEFEWPELSSPEIQGCDAAHNEMTMTEAVQLAMACERAAELFYRAWGARSKNPEVARLAFLFADEEVQHQASLSILADKYAQSES